MQDPYFAHLSTIPKGRKAHAKPSKKSMDKELLIASAAAEAEELPADFGVHVVFDINSLMATVGALQLAMRHPKFNKSPSHKTIRRAVDTMIAGIPGEMSALRELARLGDNPKYDC